MADRWRRKDFSKPAVSSGLFQWSSHPEASSMNEECSQMLGSVVFKLIIQEVTPDFSLMIKGT